MNRLLRLVSAAVAVAFVVAACGSDETPAASGGTSAAATSAPATSAAPSATGTSAPGDGDYGAATGKITIKDFKYGNPLTVKPGTQIEVVNEDTAQHDVVSDDGKFKTSLLGKGEKTTFAAPMEPGTYKFSCSVHPGTMSGIGTLVVQG